MTVLDNVAYGLKQRKVGKEERYKQAQRGARARAPDRARAGQARAALRRHAAARRARPRARHEPEGAAARRAARRARPQAAQGDAGRAQADPARRRHHVHRRDARPGGGDGDGRPHRRHERRPHRPARRPLRDLRPPGDAVRGGLHRRDEPPRGHARARRRAAGLRRRRGALRHRARRARGARPASACASACGPRRSTPTPAARARRPPARRRWCSATTFRSWRCWRRARSSSPCQRRAGDEGLERHLPRRQAVARAGARPRRCSSAPRTASPTARPAEPVEVQA